jgi:membrane fusion protein, multidrug efflux system
VQRTINWVRLANRFPVRIVLPEPDPERPFRMGATAVVTILAPAAREPARPDATLAPPAARPAP